MDRYQVAQAVRPAFEAGERVSRDTLVETARAEAAPDEVIDLLLALPDRRFGRLNALWDVLPEMPVREAEAVS